ncbi:hypothetical protein BC830DRAFT_1159895, partial [Chytriomyces sp. MP71]
MTSSPLSPPTTPRPDTVTTAEADASIAEALQTLSSLEEVPVESLRVVLQECYHALKAAERRQLRRTIGDFCARLCAAVLSSASHVTVDEAAIPALESAVRNLLLITATSSLVDREKALSTAAHAANEAGFEVEPRQVDEPETLSFKACLDRARRGDKFYQARVGWTFEYGDEIEGVKVDLIAAFEWYSKAAVQGDRHAQYLLGCLYEFGRGIPVDMEEALKWYSRASKQGDATAWSAKHRVLKALG